MPILMSAKMFKLRRCGGKTALLTFFVLCSSLACWSQTNALAVRPTDRIVAAIDDAQRVVLSGQRHPLAKPEYMIGQLPPEQPMEKMVLVLRPDAAQEGALDELIRAQQDPDSPHYHRWLTPEVFGERFGVSQNDLAQATHWLEMQGMKVDEIPSSRRSIVFSGSAGQVETAFHTQMRKYSVNGQIHFANATGPEIPQALAEVVEGVVSLHDFRSAPAHTTVPAYTLANGVNFLMPGDWQTIYDVTPLYSQGLDGSGQSIAVVGRTDIALTDVETFRTNAGLPANDPQKIFVNGVNPGMPDCVDESESALDVEWAGAIAKNATIKFVSAASGATDGVVLAAQYAVTNNVAPIVTVSYLHCENSLSDGGQSLWGALWSEAASQGQSIFVASGDSGAAGCDLASATTATQGKAVNAICSSPNSTCVGGTEFNDIYNPGVYWTATNGAGQASALSYIPELAWNETGWSGTILTASGGGVSTVYPKPGWQFGPGVPTGSMRNVPDIAATSAIHDAYVIQIQGKPFYIAGTSASAPSLASVMALVLQNAGAPWGNVNPSLYILASQQSGGGPAVFHDITSGNNGVPGVTGYSAGPGYDMVTGLGSVDALLLVNNWGNSSAWNFALTPGSNSVSVGQGNSNNAALSLTAQGGFNSPVTLSASAAPTGIAVTFSSATLAAASPVTATVTAASNVAVGNYTLTVTATGGGLTRTLSLPVTVVPSSFTLTPSATSATVSPGGSTPIVLSTAALNGFQSAVLLSVSGLPTGVTASFAPTSIAAPGNGSSTLTLAAASGTVAGSFNLTVTATGGGVTLNQPLSLTVLVPPSFTLTPSATSATVAAGGSTPIVLSTAALNGFQSAVLLSVSGLPTEVTASFAPTSIAAPGNGSSTLTLAAASGTAVGSFNLTVTATGGGVTMNQPLSLTVLVPPGFTLTPSATSATVAPGGSIPIVFSTAALNGFQLAVALSVGGLPTGVTASFAPTSIATPGNGSSTLTLMVASGTGAGSFNLTVTATGGGVTKTQPFSLTILVPPSFTLTPSATRATVAPGGSIPIVFSTAALNGFQSAIALSVSGLPKGVTASFAPTSIAAPGNGSSTLTLAAVSGTAAGSFNLTVTAAGGGVTKTQPESLTILVPPSFTLTPSATSATVSPGGSIPIVLSTTAVNGFQSAVALSVSGLPKGVTASFAPTSIAAPGNGSSTLTLAAVSGTAAGSFNLTVTAAGGGVTKTQPESLTILVPPSFTLTPSATSATVSPGGSIPIVLSTTAVNGFQSAVALSVSGLPKGVTASFAPTSIAAPGNGSSTLTLMAASGTAPGSFNLTVTATGGGVTKTQPLSLTVLVPPSFTLTPSATSATVSPGGSIPIRLSTTGVNGFQSAVALSVSGLPKGVTASFAPTSIAAPGNGSSTLTLAAASGTASGSFNLTVTATGGGVTKTQPLSLTVLASSFTLTPSATSATVSSGGSTPIRLSTTGVNGFQSAVALSVSGLPKGVTASFAPTSIAAPGNGSSTLTLMAASGTAAGSFSLTVTATGGGVTKTQPLSLKVMK